MRSTCALFFGLVLIHCGPACRTASSRQAGFRKKRAQMVRTQIKARGIKDARVLRAMGRVPRHLFVPAGVRPRAYADRPLPIGHGQTISQPYVVAYMTEALRLSRRSKVLEIGTGSGYQAAVLALVAKKVYTIEIVRKLGIKARSLLRRLKYRNVTVRIGDGYKGWPRAAPFDGIMVTAAPPRVPPALLKQLKVGAHLVMPVGVSDQWIYRYTRTAKGHKREKLLPVRFVPMTGEAQRKRR